MKLFHRKYGNGPPLVILHGLFGSSDNWITVAKKLGATFTVFLPDQRNHGQSPHSDIHDYESMRDDLYELINDLSLEKFFLAGHSMGGKTAISFALKWPDRLNGLLVADISPFKTGDTGRQEYIQHSNILDSMLSLDLSTVSSRAEASSILERSIHSKKISQFILKNLKRTHESGFKWKINALSLMKNLDLIMQGIDRKDALRQQVSGFPVIFLKGKNSDYLPEEDYHDILKIFPAAEFVEIKDAGHWLHSDNPEEVIKNFKKLITG